MVGGYWELQAAAGILATAANRVGLRGHLGIGDSRSVRMYTLPGGASSRFQASSLLNPFF